MDGYSALFAALAGVGGTVVAIVGGITGTRHVQLQAQLDGSSIAAHEAGIRVSQAEAEVLEARNQAWPKLFADLTANDAFLDELYAVISLWREQRRDPELRDFHVERLERLLRPRDVEIWPLRDQGEMWENLERIWNLGDATLTDFSRSAVELSAETTVESIWPTPPVREQLACSQRPIRTHSIWIGLLKRAARVHLFNEQLASRSLAQVREDLESVYARHAADVRLALERFKDAEQRQLITSATAPAMPGGLGTELLVLGVVGVLGVMPSVLYLTPGPRSSPVAAWEAVLVTALFTVALAVFFGHLIARLSRLRRDHGGRSLDHLRPPAPSSFAGKSSFDDV